MVSLEYYQDAVELMATGPRPEQIVSFKPSEKLQERARELVFKEKEGDISIQENLRKGGSKTSLTKPCQARLIRSPCQNRSLRFPGNNAIPRKPDTKFLYL